MRVAQHIANPSKQRDFLSEGADISAVHISPDPVGLAIAREIQRKVRPMDIIQGGSRAVGDHRPDSDVDLTAVASDEAAPRRTKEILQDSWRGSTTSGRFR